MYFEGKKFVQEFTPEKDLKAYSGHHGTDYFNPFLSTNCATKNFGEPVANVGLSRRSWYGYIWPNLSLMLQENCWKEKAE